MAQKIHITIEDGIKPIHALKAVESVIKRGRISNYGKSYCYVTKFTTMWDGDFTVLCNIRPRKSDCFTVVRDHDPHSLKCTKVCVDETKLINYEKIKSNLENHNC